MRKQCTAMAKRVLAFTLALVLVLSLVPALSLTANAAYTTDGWEFASGYTWLEGRFHTAETDLIFEDNKPYDWEVSIYQSRTSVALAVSATIKDASGQTVASVSNKSVSGTKGQDSVMLTASDMSALTADVYGTFTLVCEVKYNSSTVAKLTKTFSRVSTNPIEVSVSSRSCPDNTFSFADPIDLVLNIKKLDGVATAYNAAITVTNSSSTELLAARGVSLPVSTNIVLSLKDLVNLPAITTAGTYNLNVTLTDSTGAVKCEISIPFYVTPIGGYLDATLTDYNPGNYGNIYPTDDDFYLNLSITHTASKGQVMTVKATGTLNGSAFEASKKATLSTSTGKATVKIDGTMLGGYGFYENLSIAVYNASGVEMWRSANTYTFTRVLSTTTPGELPLVNLNDHFTSGTGDPTTKLTIAADTGANMWRSCIPWASVETSKGTFTMPSTVKTVMNDTKAQGMQALVVLAYNNDLYGDANPNDSTWLAAYANYCYQIAKYFYQNYPDQVVYYEVWNEWNAAMGKVPEDYRDGASYAKVVIAASEAVKSANPNAKIIAGALAGDAGSHGDWIRAMLNTSSAVAAMDGFSFHTYPVEQTDWLGNNYGFVSPAEHGYAATLNSLNSLLAECGAGDKEIWLTETGWATNAKGLTNSKYYTGTSEALQAAYMVQLYAWALAHPDSIDRIFWYDFMNDGVDNTQIEENWGLIRNNSDDAAYSAKPSYVALCALTSKLSGATFNATITSLGSDVLAYQFKTDSGYLVVAWTTGSTKNLTATLSGNMVVTDIYGNATTYSGTAPLTLTETPVYLEYGAASHPTIG